MRRKGVVFSKMFVLRSMGNELVPSPHNADSAVLRFRAIMFYLQFRKKILTSHNNEILRICNICQIVWSQELIFTLRKLTWHNVVSKIIVTD